MDEIVELNPDIRTVTGMVLVDDDTKIIATWTSEEDPVEERAFTRLFDFVAVITTGHQLQIAGLDLQLEGIRWLSLIKQAVSRRPSKI